MMKKLFAILLTLSMLFTMAFVASAEENTDSGDNILGSPDEMTGYILPDIATCADQTIIEGGTTYTLIFSIRANAVYSFLTSAEGGKLFVKSDAPGADYLFLTGKLTQSNLQPSTSGIRVGICYFDSLNSKYVSVAEVFCDSGDLIAERFQISTINQHQVYYTYIKNIYPSGLNSYVSGYLGLYYG